jgi:tRNA-dihydrouridine synthase C
VLLDEPDVIYALVKAVRDAVPAHIPVSAKMRLGYLDENHTLDNALAIEAAGASWLTVHARTKSDGYKPPAYWEKLPAIQQAIGIRVIANGEIWTLEQAQRCLEISGCKDLMLGRGAVTRPDLVNRVRHNNDSQQLSWPELVQLQVDFLDGATKTEQGLVGRYKQWLGMLTQGYSEAELLWNDIKKIRDMDILRAALQQHCLKQ